MEFDGFHLPAQARYDHSGTCRWLGGLHPLLSSLTDARRGSLLEPIHVDPTVVGGNIDFAIGNYGHAELIVTECISRNSLAIPQQVKSLAAIRVRVELGRIIDTEDAFN